MNHSFDQKVSDLLPNHFVFPKPNAQEAVDKFVSMSVPEPYQIREAREALIKAIKDFSALYEDEGVSFDEVKMEVVVMQMLTEHFNTLAKEQNQVCGSSSLVCDSEEKFLSFFDEGNRWFAELLIGMRELEFNNTLDIDIVLRGSQPASKIIHMSGGKINKTINDLHVTNSQLIKIVERFTGMAYGDNEVVDFSFLINGVGVFRMNFIDDSNECVMSIRCLSFSQCVSGESA